MVPVLSHRVLRSLRRPGGHSPPGLWMTLVAYVVVLVVAVPYWAAVGEPLLVQC